MTQAKPAKKAHPLAYMTPAPKLDEDTRRNAIRFGSAAQYRARPVGLTGQARKFWDSHIAYKAKNLEFVRDDQPALHAICRTAAWLHTSSRGSVAIQRKRREVAASFDSACRRFGLV